MESSSPQPTEIEISEFDQAYLDATRALPPNVKKIVGQLGHAIRTDGLNIEEACLLCNVDTDWLERTIDTHPVVTRMLAKDDLAYRMALMKPLNKKALTDDKMAQYLLELRTPKQRKNGVNNPDDSGDMLAAVISHIQKTGDSTPLVNSTNNTAIIIGKGGSAARLIDKIKSLLPSDKLA